VTNTSENNAVALLETNAARAPNRLALIAEGRRAPERATFAELWERSGRMAAGLADAGVVPGDAVVVMVPMSIDLYAVLAGILRLGAAAAFVDRWIRPGDLRRYLGGLHATAFVGNTAASLARLAEPALRRIPFAVTTGGRAARFVADASLSDFARTGAPPETAGVAGDAPAILTFTTGSSGSPKCVVRTHRVLRAQHNALSVELPYEDDDVDLPLFPVFALNNLARGVTSIIPSGRPDTGWRCALAVAAQAERHGATTCTVTPAFLDALSRSPEAGLDVRRVAVGGSVVTRDAARTWRTEYPGTRITCLYGSSEAEPVAGVTGDELMGARSDRPAAERGVCVGRPADAVRAKLIRLCRGPVVPGDDDLDAYAVEPGDVGELVVAGDHVCERYHDSPRATSLCKIVDRDGAVWHRMGDTGYVDEEGRLWLVGRLHATMRRAGRVLHPIPVEEVARGGDPEIERAAAVGVDDPALGHKVVVFVQGESGGDAGLRAQARLERAGIAVDRVVATARSLPMDPRHRSKVDHRKLARAARRLVGREGAR